MPNWCSNNLYLNGADVPKIMQIVKDAKENIFKALIGTDPSMPNTEDNWYDHNVNWFGTKWDIDENDITYDYPDSSTNTNVNLMFVTAWSPPISFFETLCNKYNISNASLMYSEQGCDFAGSVELINGETRHTEYNTYLEGMYNMDEECFWDEVAEYRLPSCAESGVDIDEVLKEFSFVTQQDRNEIINIYKQLTNESTNHE
jgi:hypothetical protein